MRHRDADGGGGAQCNAATCGGARITMDIRGAMAIPALGGGTARSGLTLREAL